MTQFLIVGQGVAGTCLGWKLWQQGATVRIVDDGHLTSSTRVAAGMVNPITGKRLTLTPNWEDMLPAARAFYREVEDRCGVTIYHEMPLQRIHRNKNERTRVAKRRETPAYAPYLGKDLPRGSLPGVSDEFGSVEIHHAGRIDTRMLLTATRIAFREADILRETQLAYDELKVETDGAVWRGEHYERVIFCDGMRVLQNPWFRELQTDPVKGEILELRFAEALPPGILNKGKWLLPTSAHEARFGATYDRRSFDCSPTAEGKEELLDALIKLLPDAITPEVTGHVAGVRICTQDNQPLIGMHPSEPRLGLFNGFGSKGNSLVPWWADAFITALCGEQTLSPHANLERVWKTPLPNDLSQ